MISPSPPSPLPTPDGPFSPAGISKIVQGPDGGLAIEAGSRADAPGVIALIGRVFAEYGFIYAPTTEVPDLRDFDRHYQAPSGEFFVVREGGLIVGSVGVERLDADLAELHRLYLDAHLRGQGTGRALVGAVLGWCREYRFEREV